jgi:uncharacterized membrane protein YgaE (UPF0421/DUF939 family)
MHEISKRFPAMSSKSKDRVTVSHIKSLGDLAKNDNVLRAAFASICESNATTKEVSDLAKTARQQTTEAAQIAVFENHASQARKESSRVVPRKTKKAFTQACTILLNMKDKQTWQSLQFQREEIEAAKKTLLDVMNIFRCLLKADG